MEFDKENFVYVVSWIIIYVAVPSWFIVAPVFSDRFKFIPKRKLKQSIRVAALVMWLLMILHTMTIEIPYTMARTDDPMYDGTGGSSAILLFGWLLALVYQLPHILTRVLLDRMKKSGEKADDDG